MPSQSPTSQPIEPLLLRMEEAARLLGISKTKAYEMVYKGELPCVRLGIARRIPFAALTQWIADHTEYGA